VFHWSGQQCSEQHSFVPDEEGFSAFNEYLANTAEIPLRLLVDLIEEDFNNETIPHVGKKDRESIVKRFIQRQYRKSDGYYHYRLKGREKEGRKDDLIQYSVLTNPDLLAPWLKIIKQNNVPLSGIWSLPRISEKIFTAISAEDKNVLLVSQQVPSNLRQSYFVNGVFESSRSAVINLEEASLGEYIAEETDQTIRFLANQRHIGFDENISIHIVCKEKDFDEIRSKCEDTPIRQFQYHNVHDIEAELGCRGLDGDYSNGLYSYLCAGIAVPRGHYGPLSLFSDFYRLLLSQSMRLAGLFMFFCSVFAMAYAFLDANDMDAKIAADIKMEKMINQQYKRDFIDIKTMLDKAQAIKSSVLFYDEVVAAKRVSPQGFMSSLGKIITVGKQSGLHITGVDWMQTQSTLKEMSGRKYSHVIRHGSDKAVRHYSHIKGVVEDKNDGIRKEVGVINRLTGSLTSNKNVVELDIIKLPLDMSEKTSFKAVEGVEKKAVGKDVFEFRLILEAHKS